MKAIVSTKYGPPEVLQLKKVEKPVPKENEVLVKVKATTVNRTDCAILSAKPYIMRLYMGLFKPKNPVMGTEFSGDVEAVGKDVSLYKIGDKVFGFDDKGVGSYAEYMSISEDKALATMPENISYEQATACIEGGHYAYNFINKVNIQSGHKVIVNGASGGIGNATVQLLKILDADITAVCDTKNIELIKSLGAVKIIDYTKEDFTKGDERYDFVFDSVGKSSFGKCKHILKPGGVYISSELGHMIQNLIFFSISEIFGSMPGQKGKKVKFPYPPDIKRSVAYLKKLIEEGKFKSVIDRSYPLEQIAEAFTYVLKGQKTGNVVIKIAQS
jgi:NADPH:quinone reductase-like Zn-dependent oxidoreductase